MKLSSIFSKVHLPASANRLLLKGKKCAPTLMIAGGTVLVIGGTVYACMQTRKAMDILDDCTNKLNSIRAMQAESNAEDYS